MRHVAEMIKRFAQNRRAGADHRRERHRQGTCWRAPSTNGRSRADGPFVAVNCAAIPSDLVASELFGYEKGAFTGAAARTKGQIEHANGGTLFLDEIGDMPVDLQGHLLRFLQEGQIVRVGGRETLKRRCAYRRRHQCATAPGDRGRPVPRGPVLPAERPVAARAAAARAPRGHRAAGAPFPATAPRATSGARSSRFRAGRDGRRCARHRWPGNVRELMSMVRRAVVIGDGPLVVALSDLIGLDEPSQRAAASAVRAAARLDAERTALLEALARTQENITLTAQELGVSRVTLYRMLRRHSINLSRGLKDPPVPGRVKPLDQQFGPESDATTG